MVKDVKTDPLIKPALLSHLEVSAKFEWPAVRRWSEEIFSMVSEDRLPKCWFSAARIQLKRMSMSRLDTACLSLQKDQRDQQPDRFKNKHYGGSQQQELYAGGGPPCLAFNSPAGCFLFSGH